MKQEFDPTKPVQTRDGRSVRILCTDRKGRNDYTIPALIMQESGFEATVTYKSDGTYVNNRGAPHSTDLINIPVVHKAYVNFYFDGTLRGYVHSDRKSADAYCGFGRFACKEIEVIEGEGLDSTEA